MTCFPLQATRVRYAYIELIFGVRIRKSREETASDESTNNSFASLLCRPKVRLGQLSKIPSEKQVGNFVFALILSPTCKYRLLVDIATESLPIS